MVRSGERVAEWAPFAGAAAIFTLAFAGALIVLPAIIGYTVFSYRVFRGKAPAKLYD